MIIIERMVQNIYPGKWTELEALDKKYNAVEARLGFPPKKRFQQLMGSNPLGTLIVERQWSGGLAALEATMEKALADPEYQALQQEGAPIIQSVLWEMYMPMP